MLHILYKTTNLVNGRYYIGIHSTPNEHDGYLGSGKAFTAALRKHGREAFQREILEFCETRELLLERERELVTLEVVSDSQSYNLKVGGEGGCASGDEHPWLARGNADDVRRRIGESQKGREVPLEKRQRISQTLMGKYCGEKSGRYGKKNSEATRKAISLAQTGRVQSEETRRKIAEKNRFNGRPRDAKLYTFRHPEHGEFVGTRDEFRDTYGLRQGAVYDVFRKSKLGSSALGWIVSAQEDAQQLPIISGASESAHLL